MNRINDKGDYLVVLRSYFFSLFHFLWFKFKRFIQKVFCEKGTLKFPKKQMQTLKNILKEFISLQSLILPKKNSFTGILKGLCLLIYNTTVFFLITDTLKTDGIEEFLHRTLQVRVRVKSLQVSFFFKKTRPD